MLETYQGYTLHTGGTKKLLDTTRTHTQVEYSHAVALSYNSFTLLFSYIEETDPASCTPARPPLVL